MLVGRRERHSLFNASFAQGLSIKLLLNPSLLGGLKPNEGKLSAYVEKPPYPGNGFENLFYTIHELEFT
jgi:hypothetical protein